MGGGSVFMVGGYKVLEGWERGRREGIYDDGLLIGCNVLEGWERGEGMVLMAIRCEVLGNEKSVRG